MSLIKKIVAPLVIMGMLAGPISAENKLKAIGLRNGYSAESSVVAYDLDLITSALLGEVILFRTKQGYEIKMTDQYDITPSDIWNNTYDNVCKSANPMDNLITTSEAQNLLDSTYDTMMAPMWVEDDSDN